MNLKNKKIGIWGYGITGRSTADFMIKQGAHTSVMDKDPLADEQDYFALHNITYYAQDQLEAFFAAHDLIIPSAGIDLRPYYQKYKDKWLFELDIFAHFFTKPYIAITGSVGKTTITSLLSQLLEMYGFKIITGGNIGIASLDLIAHQDDVDYAVLEVSSFQLEHTTRFTPYLAIITNITENHLDRHGTMDEYIRAKKNILMKAYYKVLPAELLRHLTLLESTRATLFAKNQHKKIISQLPPITFEENWLAIIKALTILGCSLRSLSVVATNLKMPEHRIEYVTTIRGAKYYNDSKSTAPAATQAAVEKFAPAPIHLLLGGLSKGLNREPLIASLRGKVAQVYCFGKETDMLHALCTKHEVPSSAFASLEQAVEAAHHNATPESVVLLSPAGSSYDLFENFEHRGQVFKELVLSLEPALRPSTSSG